MKKGLIFLLLCTALFSCKKDETYDSVRRSLTGTWELTGVACAECSPSRSKSYLIFKNDRYYFYFDSPDNSFSQGKYKIVSGSDCGVPLYNDFVIIFEGDDSRGQRMDEATVKDGVLKLSTPFCYSDLTIRVYSKVE